MSNLVNLYGRFSFRAWDENMQDYWDWEEIQDDWESEGYYDSIFRQDHWVCEQCTGIKDKNGKYIFENDLLKDHNGIWQVKWNNKEAAFYLWNKKRDFYLSPFIGEYEIVGNIHETPELAEE